MNTHFHKSAVSKISNFFFKFFEIAKERLFGRSPHQPNLPLSPTQGHRKQNFHLETSFAQTNEYIPQLSCLNHTCSKIRAERTKLKKYLNTFWGAWAACCFFWIKWTLLPTSKLEPFEIRIKRKSSLWLKTKFVRDLECYGLSFFSSHLIELCKLRFHQRD